MRFFFILLHLLILMMRLQSSILPRHNSARVQVEILDCAYTWFSMQSSNGTCHLKELAAFPIKSPERMHWCCISHYVCML